MKAEPTPEPTCATCRFFLEPNTDETSGTCRFNPPVAIVRDPSDTEFQVMGVFAPTNAGQWCGKYEAQKVDFFSEG